MYCTNDPEIDSLRPMLFLTTYQIIYLVIYVQTAYSLLFYTADYYRLLFQSDTMIKLILIFLLR